MAKKKKRKEDTGTKVKFSSELTGLIFVLISVIGIGPFGPVGELIKSFAIFLMGTSWAVIITLILILGLYMIAKRDVPKFFSAKMIGLYFLIISWLALSHRGYFQEMTEIKFGEIMQNTIESILVTIKDSNFTNVSQTGGGIVGAFFGAALVNLFEVIGAYIVLGVLVVFGVIMLLDVSISDIVSKIKQLFRSLKKGVKESKVFKLPDDDATEEEGLEKVIITSAENMKQFHNEKVQDLPTESTESIKFENSTNGNYRLPPINLLNVPIKNKKINSTEFLQANKVALEKVLSDFQIIGKVVEIHEGPAVTQYEVEIKAATKLNRITGIYREIALALAAKEVRILAPIPGKSTVGIEIPNKQIVPVPIRDVLTTIPKNMMEAKILLSLGKDLMGRTICADLNKMTHLLVAGATGSGKSVCINSFIASILMHKRPDETKLVLIDPKKVELSNYNGVPHLLCPVVTDPKKANIALQKIVSEMDRRYTLFEEKGVKNISAYNELIDRDNKKNLANIPKLPYIVVIIDELADLMLVAAKEVEDSIMRITQMARAAGIHLVVATQRPSTDVITGIVKANIPSRIAFTVASQIDSRTILDSPGAEKLLGKGDMLYLPMGENHPTRIQGTFISDEEIQRLIDYVSKEQIAQYDNSITEVEPDHMAAGAGYEKEEYEDPLYNEIVDFAITSGKISASLVQRRFRLGYNRAARVIDLLEERGIIGPQNGSKPRDVLVKLKDEDNE
jgi:S-DNA-T family DNA segregation ATPase FtsK/SpoIIIE